jgi:hypothetical protein
LQNSHGPIFRRKTARLEDFTCGNFQTSSILASRDAASLAKDANLHDLSKLHYRIKTIDPGHVYQPNGIRRVSGGREDTICQRGNKLGNTHTRKRVEKRLARAVEHRQQPARLNDPIDCILRCLRTATLLFPTSSYYPRW